jgi:hypothetical protein
VISEGWRREEEQIVEKQLRKRLLQTPLTHSARKPAGFPSKRYLYHLSE